MFKERRDRYVPWCQGGYTFFDHAGLFIEWIKQKIRTLVTKKCSVEPNHVEVSETSIPDVSS